MSLPLVGSKGAKVTLTHREWDRLRNLLQDQPQFRFFGVPEDKALLDKLDWHCADTYEPPADDGRQWPQADNE